MPFNMMIYCTTLGKAPSMKNINNSFAVIKSDPDKNIVGTPIEHIWNWAAECSRLNGGIKTLLIACHGGYEGGVNDARGGWGIKLGTGLNQKNVNLTEKLAGRVKSIHMYVCGGAQQPNPALLGPGNDYSNYAHNRETCQLMAKYSKCNVIAATGLQSFQNSWWDNSFDFGEWEGKVELFRPDGAVFNVTGMTDSFGSED